MKHIEIDRLFIKKKLINDVLRLDHVTSNEQLVVVRTKELSNKTYHTLICKLGMCDIYAPTWGRVLTNIEDSWLGGFKSLGS